MNILYSIIILPIESLVEFIFYFSYREFSALGVGGAIIAVSLAINFLALPLYNKAESLQLKEREIQLKMAKQIERIKTTFKGDEQFMMLNAWYKINGYHPAYAVRSALSILIEIPFFIAAYHFLSHCSALNGQSVLFLKNLGKPDGLIAVFGMPVNVLPILMTTINGISTAVYTKGAPLREKLQTYILALVFLVLLYESPSGLVFYWILNNTFSLFKNIVLKMKHPGKIVYGFFSAASFALCLYLIFFMKDARLYKKAVVFAAAVIVMAYPFIYKFLKAKIIPRLPSIDLKSAFPLFLCSSLVLWVLTGLYIPSSIIASGVTEFSFHGNTPNPSAYIWSSIYFFFGLFVFWPLVIYRMFDEKTRRVESLLFFTISSLALANVFLFKYDYGSLSITFTLNNMEVLENVSAFYSILPLIAIAIFMTLFFAFMKFRKTGILTTIFASILLAGSILGFSKISSVNKEFYSIQEEIKTNSLELKKDYHLSRTEKNVIVFFLDRAISSFFPYIADQFPQVKNSFKGFTYYPNTISFGAYTNLGTPAMNGGYEYTPKALSVDTTRLLKDKHNESLLVMPTLFADSGWSVTMRNLPYPDYTDRDYSAFKKYKNIDFGSTFQKYSDKYKKEFLNGIPDNSDRNILKSSKYFSILQIALPVLRSTIYHDGQYFYDAFLYPLNESFIEEYSSLYYLPEATDFTSSRPTFTYIGNNATHEYTTLTMPDLRPGQITLENKGTTGSYKFRRDEFSGNDNDYQAYLVNASALIQLGKYFDHLRKNNIWDNTRIIIVADHGRELPLPVFDGMTHAKEASAMNPLLLFKDFNSNGEIITDGNFMTNAETLNLARKDLPVSDTNPFTGNKFKCISDIKKVEIFVNDDFRIGPLQNRTTVNFQKNRVFTVKDSIFNDSNWEQMQ